MIKIIKEFLLFRRMMKYYQTIDLDETDKNKLEAFDKKILKILKGKSYNMLVREVLDDNVSRDYTL
jgi:hypothetical protein